MRPDAVIERRLAEREQLIERARAFVAALTDALDVRAAVVFGSVARGDFNAHSDIDVLVVANAPEMGYWERQRRLGVIPAGVQPVVWTPDEWRRQRARGNAIAVESERHGVWLAGDPETM